MSLAVAGLLKKHKSLKSFSVCVFHGPHCADGVCAAWCVQKVNPHISLHFVSSKCDTSHLDLRGQSVLFVDVCPDIKSVLDQGAINVAVLDHHESANEEQKRWPNHVFVDINLSACELAWQASNNAKPIPRFLRLIGRRDIWDFDSSEQQEESHSLNLALNLPVREMYKLKKTFGLIDKMTMYEIHVDNAILRYHEDWLQAQKWIKMCESKCFWVRFMNARVLMLDSVDVQNPKHKQSWDDLAFHMLKRPTTSTFMILHGHGHVSLRSRPGVHDPYNALSIARQLGGGGHCNSAGAKIDNVILQELKCVRKQWKYTGCYASCESPTPPPPGRLVTC
jgi:oligoribonuclease NrnB/cAMP/cGMP phosphodiesterase (DHH superfamily)